jgi:plasmid stabilization system protein ParE
MTKALVSFPASDEFRDAITVAATAQNISRAELIRISVANTIGYNLANESRIGRPQVYESPEARKKAQRERQANQRKLEKRIIDMIRIGEKQEDIQALLDSLDRKIT